MRMVGVMLEHAQGLNDVALEAIASLERRVVSADGGRLKLEWGTLRHRKPAEARDLLWWGDGRLLGFAGIYGFGWPTLELTGMVDPAARRRGIGRALLDQALLVCGRLGGERALLVVPRTSAGGRELALRLGMTHEHSEHALTLRQRPSASAPVQVLSLREATAQDVPALSNLYLDGFGDARVDDDRPLVDRGRRTLMVIQDGEAVGTLALTLEGDRGAVHGFVVASQQRGRGIGRAALARACSELFDNGATHVELEVEVVNDRALGLYESIGFSRLATDDYYELKLST